MQLLEVRILQSVPSIVDQCQILSLKSRKAEALLLYVCLAGETSYRRDFLASLLWEDRDPQLARDNLRQTLSRIKRKCGNMEPAITVGRKTIEVDRSLIRVDAQVLLDKIATAGEELHLAELDFDFDDMFSGYHDIGFAFSSWTKVFQSGLEKRLSQALQSRMDTPGKRPDQAAHAADMLLKLDPTNEAAVRSKMAYLADIGERAEALRVYNALYQLLDEEYDVEPSAETIDLNAAIKLGQRAPAIAVPDDTLTETPEIFVNGFDISESDRQTNRLGRFFSLGTVG